MHLHFCDLKYDEHDKMSNLAASLNINRIALEIDCKYNQYIIGLGIIYRMDRTCK